MQSADPGLEIVHPHAAGIDVGNSAHYVAVRPDHDPELVRRFECFTADLYQLADWLDQCGVKTVAPCSPPESIGSPSSEFLKTVVFMCIWSMLGTRRTYPGRKSDVRESQWLQKLHTYG